MEQSFTTEGTLALGPGTTARFSGAAVVRAMTGQGIRDAPALARG